MGATKSQDGGRLHVNFTGSRNVHLAWSGMTFLAYLCVKFGSNNLYPFRRYRYLFFHKMAVATVFRFCKIAFKDLRTLGIDIIIGLQNFDLIT